jgi:hypothetical protein
MIYSILHCKIVYICVLMTCSTSYCLCDTLMDPRNVCMYVCVCVYVCKVYVYVCVGMHVGMCMYACMWVSIYM